MTSIIKAIVAINPDAKVSITSGDIKQIQWHNTTPIAEEDILAKQKEYNRKNRGKLREYERNRYWNGNNNEPSLKIRYGELIVTFE